MVRIEAKSKGIRILYFKMDPRKKKKPVYLLEAHVGVLLLVFLGHMAVQRLTEQQRFETQSPHFVHSARHQWHPLDMSHLKG